MCPRSSRPSTVRNRPKACAARSIRLGEASGNRDFKKAMIVFWLGDGKTTIRKSAKSARMVSLSRLQGFWSRSGSPVQMQRNESGIGTFRIFTVERNQVERSFDPAMHHAVLAIDCHSTPKRSVRGMHANLKCIAIFIEVFRRLQIDLTVLAFSDQIIKDDASGHETMVHLRSVLKSAREPFDGRFYNRLTSVLARPLNLPGATRCCFHPLLFRSSLEALSDAEKQSEYTKHRLLMVANRNMPRGHRFNRSHFLSRAADAIDRMIDHNEHKLTGHYETACCIIPTSLKRNAKPGGETFKMMTI